MKVSTTFSLFVVSVLSQECREEVVIDDFSTIRPGWLDNLPKTFNALGGAFGV